MALGDALPYPHNIQLSETFDIEKVAGYLPPDFFSTPSTATDLTSEPTSEINKVALILSLFGWAAMPNYTHSAAECTACFRRLGLWLFKSKEISSTGEEIIGAAMNYLDPIKEHRDYCPWKNAVAQSGSLSRSTPNKNSEKEMFAAWEIVLRVLRNDSLLRNPKKVVSTEVKESDVWGDKADDPDAKSIREEKEKEWSSRLRRVKSLFNTKEKKKMNRM